MSLDVLVAEYPGDHAWERFAGAFPSLDRAAVLDLPDKAMARVLVAKLGSRAPQWLAQPIRVLDGRTPTEVLANYPQGILALRTALMRMPS
jgi:hypothetical protein